MRRKILLGLCLPLLFAFTQNDSDSYPLTWDLLKKHVSFTEKYNKSVDLVLLYPTFSEEIKKMDGKKAHLKGYMIESDPAAGIYVLSRYPMAQCYFCGGAGPESIVEVQLKSKSKRYRTDQLATITGVFELNAVDIEHCNYMLKDAVVKLE
ncbi:MAG: DUF3299 domain-containing protein [Flammeovirgaceae bacterium]